MKCPMEYFQVSITERAVLKCLTRIMRTLYTMFTVNYGKLLRRSSAEMRPDYTFSN